MTDWRHGAEMASSRGDVGGDSQFLEFAGRLTNGEQEATQVLLDRYSVRLVALARSRLGTRLRPKADPEDVFQSVLRTFFRRLGSGEIELRDWSTLSGLLSLLTLRKVQSYAQHYGAARRDPRREVALFLDEDGRVGPAIPDREPTPDEVATFVDLLETLLKGLDEQDRRFMQLMIAGESVAAIAVRQKCAERTVYRSLARVRQRLLMQQGGRDEK